MLCVLVVAIGCDTSAGVDAGFDSATPPRTDAGPDPSWPHELPSSSTLGDRRGRTIARSIIHLHSPLSHDACDGEGWVDGALADAACLTHFRDAMCALRLDAVMMSDHVPHLDEVDFADALWIMDGDEPVMDGADIIANRMLCPDGHRVLLTVGSENALMPLALSRHVADRSDLDVLRALYEGDDAVSTAAFRAAGGLVWQAHTEGRTLEQLRAADLDGTELYNLHANLDPRIRVDDLGLEATPYLPNLLDFTRAQLRLPPDLAVLSFMEVNQVSLDRWDTLLAEGLRVAGSGGCDAHENTFPMPLADGERADSYRRMMYWIGNHLLVDEPTIDGVRDALGSLRFYVVSEVFGPPLGFDFTADGTIEMGQDAPLGSTLRVTMPRLPDDWPREPAPILTARLLRSAAGGAVEVASGDGDLVYAATEAGAYRVEIRMIPEHMRPELGNRADRLIHEVVWVYSNPIFVTP